MYAVETGTDRNSSLLCLCLLTEAMTHSMEERNTTTAAAAANIDWMISMVVAVALMRTV
jgi:hypothetical protein